MGGGLPHVSLWKCELLMSHANPWGGEMSPVSFGDLVTVLCVHWKNKMDDQNVVPGDLNKKVGRDFPCTTIRS